MFGVIRKQKMLEDLFTSTFALQEVYVDKSFSLEQDSATFYILLENMDFYKDIQLRFDHPKFLNGLQSILDYKTNFYIAYSSYDILLENKKLIWRKGRWYNGLLPSLR